MHLSKYHKNLPQNITRPEDEMVDAVMPLFNVQNGRLLLTPGLRSPAPPFPFTGDCWVFNLVIGDPIPFNSTGNIQLGNVVRYHRGEATQMDHQGHDNATKSSGIPPWEQNPPFPPGSNLEVWGCFDNAIGDSSTRGSFVPPVIICMALILFAIPVLWLRRVWGVRHRDLEFPDDSETTRPQKFDEEKQVASGNASFWSEALV